MWRVAAALMLSCASTSSSTGESAAPAEPDAAAAAFVGTWAVGQTVTLDSGLSPTFVFAPRASASPAVKCDATACTFTPDVPGDYVLTSDQQRAAAGGPTLLRVAVLSAADNFTSRAMLLQDSFDRPEHQLNSTDVAYEAWHATSFGLLTRGSLNWNAQPLDIRLEQVAVSASSTLELGLYYSSVNQTRQQLGEGLFVEVAGGATDASVRLRIKGGSSCDKGTRCTLATRPLPRCPASRYSVGLDVNGGWWGGNASVAVSCGGSEAGPDDVLIQIPHKLLLRDAPPSAFGIPSGDVKLSLTAATAAADGTTGCVPRINSTTGGEMSLGACASLAAIAVQSGFDGKTLPRVVGDTSDWLPIGARTVNLGTAHADNLRLGILDVTLPPFSADSTGVVDATQALQRAIDFAYRHYLVVYLPIGRYLVSDTLNATQFRRFGSMGTRFGAISIRGELRAAEPNARATLVLADSAPGFTSFANGTRAVLDMWHEQMVGDQDQVRNPCQTRNHSISQNPCRNKHDHLPRQARDKGRRNSINTVSRRVPCKPTST